MDQQFKIVSDPVHGFISVPRGLIYDLLQTPEVQRLRRIRQLGVSNLIFPGAEHTRFSHALGSMALMQETLAHLAQCGTPISAEERTASLAVALLHDVGHGPFSHTLEHTLIGSFRHEDMSLGVLRDLNERFSGALDLAIRIFTDEYERPFFHDLIAGQLDMDRLDYLRRDSFFTGVVEGRVGVERILKTLRVFPTEGGPGSRVVVEAKGIYAVENFLISRRLMYWQVYLHKTVLAGDHILMSLFKRVRSALTAGDGSSTAGISPALLFFLQSEITGADVIRSDVRRTFCELDDVDVLAALKQWRRSADPILADLCRRFLDRDLYKVTFLDEVPDAVTEQRWRERVAGKLLQVGLDDPQAEYYLIIDRSGHRAYSVTDDDAVAVLTRSGEIKELSELTDLRDFLKMDKVTRHYVCYPAEYTPFE